MYVDNVLIASRSDKEIDRISDHLERHFNIRRIGDVRQCLGIEFCRKEDTITMSQGGYIDEVLKRFGMEECNPVSTPLDPSLKLEKANNKPPQNVPFQELVGCLTYLVSIIRSDIAYTAS